MILTVSMLYLNSAHSQSKDTLTNQTIIQLTQMGLQPEVISMKIKNSYTKFDVSTNSLIILSDKKVSSEVIGEMIKAASNRLDLNQVAVKEIVALRVLVWVVFTVSAACR